MAISFHESGYEAADAANILTQHDAEAFLRGVCEAIEASLELANTGEAYKGYKVRFQIESRVLDS